MDASVSIGCALRWGVASIEVISTGRWLTLYEKIFLVRNRHRWTNLIRDRNYEESRRVAFNNLFVKYFGTI